MKDMQRLHLALGIALMSVVSGCGGEPAPAEEVVVDTLEGIEDGQFKAWKLDAGTYRVEMTASGDGATVKWVGSSCPGAEETAEYSSICEMKQTGQLIVENSSTLGLGATTTVTLKVTKIESQQ